MRPMPATLLLVQGNSFLARMNADALGTHGHRVVQAQHATQALSAIREQRFDLALLDLDMRRGEGESLLHSVAGRLPFVPLILMQGSVNYQDAVARHGPGRAVWRLDKPYAIEALAGAVRRLLMAGPAVAPARDLTRGRMPFLCVPHQPED